MSVASEFLDYVSKYQVATYVGVEDFADKFNFIVTVTILLLCTTIVTVKQYMMKPIACYMATDIGGKNLLEYVENYCWVQGTIPMAHAERIPETEGDWQELEKKKLLYYQWVPFVLGLQCILFYLPRLLWQMICYNRTGTDIQHLVLSANQAVHSTDEMRSKLINHVARTLEQLLFQQEHKRITYKHKSSTISIRSRKSGIDMVSVKLDNTQHQPSQSNQSIACLTCLFFFNLVCRPSVRWKRYQGTFLSLAYLLVKLTYLANCIGQLFLMRRFLGFSSPWYSFGLRVLIDVMHGFDWQVTQAFPRVGYCAVPVKHMGTLTNSATAQCVLPVNMLNEKLYVFLWWWFLLVGLLTWSSMVKWTLRAVSCWSGNFDFVSHFLLQQPAAVDDDDRLLVKQFVRKFLHTDGVFLLRMLSNNAGDLVTGEIVTLMWTNFKAAKLASAPVNSSNEQLDDRVKLYPSVADLESQRHPPSYV